MWTDGQKDTHYETNSGFTKFCERAYKNLLSENFWKLLSDYYQNIVCLLELGQIALNRLHDGL